MCIGGADGQAFLYIEENEREKKPPDIQLVMVSVPFYGDHIEFEKEIKEAISITNPYTHGFQVAIGTTRPKSRVFLS